MTQALMEEMVALAAAGDIPLAAHQVDRETPQLLLPLKVTTAVAEAGLLLIMGAEAVAVLEP